MDGRIGVVAHGRCRPVERGVAQDVDEFLLLDLKVLDLPSDDLLVLGKLLDRDVRVDLPQQVGNLIAQVLQRIATLLHRNVGLLPERHLIARRLVGRIGRRHRVREPLVEPIAKRILVDMLVEWEGSAGPDAFKLVGTLHEVAVDVVGSRVETVQEFLDPARVVGVVGLSEKLLDAVVELRDRCLGRVLAGVAPEVRDRPPQVVAKHFDRVLVFRHHPPRGVSPIMHIVVVQRIERASPVR